jgi:four helix bundle protein
MKYGRFEDLPVWKSALDLFERVYRLTRSGVLSQSGDLRDRLRRAALSVSNNIAEGFERGTTSELLMFLYIARGSAGEVRSMLHVCERLTVVDGATEPGHRARSGGNRQQHSVVNRPSEISNLKSEISGQRSPL